MSVSSATFYVNYAGRGDTGPYSITFPVTIDDEGNAEDVVVRVTDSDGVEVDITSTATITGTSVYTAESYDSTNIISITREPALTQDSEYPFGTKFPASRIERDFDKSLFRDHYLKLLADRSFKLPVAEIGDTVVLPTKEQRKGRLLKFNETTGAPEAVLPYYSDEGLAVSAFGESIIDDESAEDMLATFLASMSAGDVLTELGFSDFAQTLIDDADAATARATLGVTPANLGISAFGQTLVDDANAAAARSTLGAIASADAVDLANTQTVSGTKYMEGGARAAAPTQVSNSSVASATWIDIADVSTSLPSTGAFLVEVRGVFGNLAGTGPGQHPDGSTGVSLGLFFAGRVAYGPPLSPSYLTALTLLSETNSGSADLQVSGTKIQAKHAASSNKAMEFHVSYTLLGNTSYTTF